MLDVADASQHVHGASPLGALRALPDDGVRREGVDDDGDPAACRSSHRGITRNTPLVGCMLERRQQGEDLHVHRPGRRVGHSQRTVAGRSRTRLERVVVAVRRMALPGGRGLLVNPDHRHERRARAKALFFLTRRGPCSTPFYGVCGREHGQNTDSRFLPSTCSGTAASRTVHGQCRKTAVFLLGCARAAD